MIKQVTFEELSEIEDNRFSGALHKIDPITHAYYYMGTGKEFKTAWEKDCKIYNSNQFIFFIGDSEEEVEVYIKEMQDAQSFVMEE